MPGVRNGFVHEAKEPSLALLAQELTANAFTPLR